MSTPNPQDAHDPNSLLYYAPRRLRDRTNALRALQLRREESGQSIPTAAIEQRSGYDATLSENPFPEALQPASEPEPIEPLDLIQQRARRNEVFAIAARFVAVTGIAGVIALFYVMTFAGSRDQAPSSGDSGTSLATMPQSKKLAMDKSFQKMTVPTLAVEDAEGNINELLPLGVKVTNHMPSATVNLSGLIADTKLTTGTPSGTGEWRVAVNDLATTAVIPPHDYVGQMNIVVELHDGNGQAVLRNAVRLNWKQITPRPATATRLQTPAANVSPAIQAAEPETARQIDPEELAALIKRGEELASNGDTPAARLLLQRAAEAHNARAAFELAVTYDPIVIRQLGNNSARPDLSLARAWYQKARDWGSPDAPKQLEALASTDR